MARAAAAFLLYLALAVALTFPLALRLSSAIPHDAGDPVLNGRPVGPPAHVPAGVTEVAVWGTD